jgi:hypothetical protein
VDRRSRKLLAVVLSSLPAFVSIASVANAAPKDAAATKLQRDAMDNDYLATNFAEAEKKLKQAIKICGTKDCSPGVLAKLHRDLGVVYIGGMNKKDDGKAEFAAAIAADASVALDKDLTTPDIQKAFDEAKSGGSTAATNNAGGGGDEEEEKPKKKKHKQADSDASDIVHTPPAEQAVLTPVPIYCELPDDIDATKVEVRYKPFGVTEWKTLVLKKMGGGYGGEVPCLDIGSTTGDLSYYIQAIDSNGDVVATNGTRSNPLKVPIRNELKGDPPHLPNKPPPAQCEDAGDCPPGLPGCEGKGKKHTKHGDKGWGASCDTDAECQEGLACKNGQCDSAPSGDSGAASSDDQPAGKACESNADCDDGVSCTDGFCGGAGGAGKKWLVSFAFEPDMALVSGTDVCTPESQQNNGYACFRADGQQYRGLPTVGAADAIAGGAALATVRVLVGLDRVVTKNITVGARVGYAFRGGPATDNGTKFLPFHAELRLAYWLGDHPFTKKGIRPYVFLAGGLAQVDAKVPVEIQEETDPTLRSNYSDYLAQQTDNPDRQSVDAWKKMGQSFAGGGGGIMYATTAKGGFLFDLKIMQMFPSSGTVIAPELGYVFGM